MNLAEEIRKRAAEHHPGVVASRRYLHAHPELSFCEYETAKYIVARLEEWGISFRTGVARTGVVGTITGLRQGGKTIALRADMDALPITESGEKEYRSVNAGTMHACGHDVHMASLLGTAQILQELRESFGGTVILIFQPAEEKLPGGASVMIREGVLSSPVPASILAQHVMPELECGKVGFRPGKYMASCDELYVTVKGKGGHAAQPQHTINPILIASRIITELYDSRHGFTNQDKPSVLSFGKISAGGTTNVIPGEARMEGTFRAMDEKWRDEAHRLMKSLAEKIAHESGGSCDIRIEKGYPYLENDVALTARARQSAEMYLGKENVTELDRRMTSEDFSFYTHHVPGCFYRLGVRNESRGITSPVHTPTFDIDEKALETGVGLMAWIAVHELGDF